MHVPMREKLRKRLAQAAAVLIACMLLVGPTAPAHAQDRDPEAVALRLLDRLDAGQWREAESMFTAQMAAAVPADKLQAVWTSLPAQVGPAQGRGSPRVERQDATALVTVPLRYANAELVAKIAVDAQGSIAGFLVQPAPPPPAPPPADDAAFVERELSVGGGETALPGTLSLPKAASPGARVPGVVLVHGSGPNDRDETVGANRPFRDLAHGLAQRGIAVLRYEKRTRARPQDFAERMFDMDDETTDDAVAAVAALAEVEAVDARRVFVLGHSQGGLLAPRIAARSGKVAGLVLLAAPARPLLDLLAEQNRYLVSLDGEISAQEQAHLDALDAQIAAVRDPAADATTPGPLGLPAGYWRPFEALDPVADARAAGLPLLVLHGGRDMQVVDADWQRWKQAFGGDANATLRHYPALNHLGIAGEGRSTPAEYMQAGSVDATLIADTAGWIHATASD
jgi:uncharacterized protein